MSPPKRPEFFNVSTPFPGAQTVVCYQDTWEKKLVQRVVNSAATIILDTLREPGAVVAGSTNPKYVAFVSGSHLSAGSERPFVVFVDPEGSPKPAVASVGYRRDFKNLANHELLWSPSTASKSQVE